MSFKVFLAKRPRLAPASPYRKYAIGRNHRVKACLLRLGSGKRKKTQRVMGHESHENHESNERDEDYEALRESARAT